MYRTLSDSYRLSYSNLWVALLSQVCALHNLIIMEEDRFTPKPYP